MGSNDSSQQQQLAQQNAAQAAQQAQENARLSQVQSAVSPYLTGEGQGFTPAQLAALNTSVIDQNAQKYGAATQQTNAQLAARGENGMTPVSGVAAGAYGNLNAARASDLASGLNTNVLNNAQQALTNRMNAASILSGNAQTLAQNVGTYGSGASNALSNVTQAQNNGFFNNFAKGLGAGIGGGASSAAIGGAGTFASTLGSGQYGW